VTLDITGCRLRNQRLDGGDVATPQEVVRWLGAVQAQEYAEARWAIALRMRRATEAAIERAFAAGAILRTHVMRPTWHFVAPEDLRWLLALTGPRVSAAMASYNRRLGLDAAVFRKTERAIVRALHGVALTRQELKQVLERSGIRVEGAQRLAFLVMQAELDAVICSGPRRDRQFTYALLDERVPPARTLTRDEALSALARRYFTSHGPAQLRDFVWWSGLRMADARNGLAAVEPELATETIDGLTYWSGPTGHRRSSRFDGAYLLPLYDEYLIAYRDRTAAIDPSGWSQPRAHDPFSAAVVLDGQVVGSWRRVFKQNSVAVRVTPFKRWRRRDVSAVEAAAYAYATFLGKELELAITS
jgi:hypothetical protein